MYNYGFSKAGNVCMSLTIKNTICEGNKVQFYGRGYTKRRLSNRLGWCQQNCTVGGLSPIPAIHVPTEMSAILDQLSWIRYTLGVDH